MAVSPSSSLEYRRSVNGYINLHNHNFPSVRRSPLNIITTSFFIFAFILCDKIPLERDTKLLYYTMLLYTSLVKFLKTFLYIIFLFKTDTDTAQLLLCLHIDALCLCYGYGYSIQNASCLNCGLFSGCCLTSVWLLPDLSMVAA